MIYALYLVVAAAIVFLAIKLSAYVDMIEKKTTLSGAFIGGVILSGITSLPELFTSLSATMFLDNPGLCMGNILGSNIFNLSILAVLGIVFAMNFSYTTIAKSHSKVTVYVLALYVVLWLNFEGILSLEFLSINITSVIIIVIYIIGVKNMSADTGELTNVPEEEMPSLTMKQITTRFVFASIGIVGLSIGVTYITDEIALRLGLGSGIAGALLLGIATSLPELSSTCALFKLKNYNIAVGNIVGSNLFNLLILSIADILYLKSGIYDYSDPKTVNLLIFGAIGTALVFPLINLKKKKLVIISALLIVVCYGAFLIV